MACPRPFRAAKPGRRLTSPIIVQVLPDAFWKANWQPCRGRYDWHCIRPPRSLSTLRRIGVTKLLAVLVLIGTGLFASTPTADAALAPNYSIFIYKPGTAVTGTLKGGVFKQKHTLSMTGWEAAAASRDTLLLYNGHTGMIRTGTFDNGIFTAKAKYNVGGQWDHVLASCDTVMFYDSDSGAAFTATLKGGTLGPKTHYALDTTWDLVDASCDTVEFIRDGSPTIGVLGVLKSGKFTQSPGSFNISVSYWAMTHTASSFLLMSRPSQGQWGPSHNGVATITNSANDFGPWDLVAGTADSVLFYESNGAWATVTLVDGVYKNVNNGSSFSPGWTLIVGGR